MKHRSKSNKYFWVTCIRKDDPECKVCPHAQSHQSKLTDGIACPGECTFKGCLIHCIPTRRPRGEEDKEVG